MFSIRLSVVDIDYISFILRVVSSLLIGSDCYSIGESTIHFRDNSSVELGCNNSR